MSVLRVLRFPVVGGSRPYPVLSSFAHISQCRQKFSTTTVAMAERHFQRPAVFVCDIQEKFRNAIWQFDKIVTTAQKVLRAAQTLNVPVMVTTQNAAKLGSTVSELEPLISGAKINADKTAFSMLRVPPIAAEFAQVTDGAAQQAQVAIVGIESHICVTQTALDLVARGHRVYVLADGVSSCNEQEVPIALARLRAAGVTVTTSESWLYECMGDAAIPEFRDVAKIVKETSASTKAVLGDLLSKI
ncbi:Isochorismatase hydrolase [Hypoxylon sp. FL1150]|nr:Isochorismatase hydrolase [Hypoxylon sp. FL1150]